MDICGSREILASFLRDELPPKQMARVSEHVENCECCEGILAALANERIADIASMTDEDVGSGSSDTAFRQRYELVRVFAQGGLGRIWLARDRELARDVAVKELHSDKALDRQARRRFIREAQITGQLEHPNIIPIYEFGAHEDSGRLYYVMRRLGGRTLREAIGAVHTADGRKRRLPAIQRLLAPFLQVCHAIAYAHSRHVIHRDLKPDNVLLGEFGEVVVLDWGLAKAGDAREPDAELTPAEQDPPEDESAANATQDGWVLGSPAYMAPEQVNGDAGSVGPQADIYGLGAILFEILSGQAPHQGKTSAETLAARAAGPAPRLRSLAAHVPPALDAICATAMAEEPADRYESVQALIDDLERFMRDEPVSVVHEGILAKAGRWFRRKPSRAAFSVLSLVALIALIAWGLTYHAWQGEFAANQQVRQLRDRALYSAHVRYASQSFQIDNLEIAAEALAMCPESQRNWEWDRLTWMVDTHRPLALSGNFRPFFTPDQQQLVTSDSARKRLVVWNLKTGQAQRTFGSHEVRMDAIALAPAGDLVATCCQGTVHVWDFESGVLRWSDQAHSLRSDGMSFSPDGRWVASSSYDGTLKVWNAQSGDLRWQAGPLECQLRGVEFSPDGNRLVTASYVDGPVGDAMVWDAANGQRLLTLPGQGSWIFCATFANDGAWIVTGDNVNTVKVWDAATGTELRSLHAHKAAVHAVAASPDGRWIVSGGADNVIYRWDTLTFLPAPRKFRLPGVCNWINFSPDGAQLASVASSGAARIRVWDMTPESGATVLPDPAPRWWSVAFSADSKTLAAGADDKVALWNAITGQRLCDVPGVSARSVAISPDGKLVASGGDSTIALSDAVSGELLDTLPTEDERIYCLAFSPDGRYFASCGRGNVVRLWDVKIRAIVREFTGHANQWAIYSLAFHPTRPLIASAAADGTVKLWNVETGELVHDLKPGVDGEFPCVAFTPDGQRVIAGHTDTTLWMWDVASGELAQRFRGPHETTIWSLSFNPDGSRLVSGDAAGMLVLWDVSTGEPCLTIGHESQAVWGVAFAPDGQSIATASGQLKLWHRGPDRED